MTCYVTANFLAKNKDRGNKRTITKANPNAPNAAAQQAFNNIKAITPAFTAFPIFLPIGSFYALYKGAKIIHAKGNKKTTVNSVLSRLKEKIKIAKITSRYKAAAI